MASTGMALKGDFGVTVNGTDIERVGSSGLPSTNDNESVELVSNRATRKEIVMKGGFQDVTLTCFFNPDNYQALKTIKNNNSVCTVSYSCAAADGGSYIETYLAQVINVAGAEGDVSGLIESFDVTFGIKSLVTASGSLGTLVYND